MIVAAPLLLPLVAAVATAPSTPPPKIESHTLANGLTVLVAENHTSPIVHVEIAAKNGSMTEPPEYNGLSHLYEHMFFKANAAYPSQEAWMARTKELGAEWNGTTQTERVNYFFTTTSDHLADTMEFMHAAIVTPKFDAKELDRERVVVTGEMDRNEANPLYFLFHDVGNAVFFKYPSRKDPLGNRKTVLTATVAKMQTIQHRYYVPNNSVLVVTGDVHAADVFAQADKLYADWKKADDPFVKFPLVTHPPLPKTAVVFVEQPAVHTITGVLEWHGPSTIGPSVADSYAADVLSTAVNQPSSKWHAAIVDSGACLGVGLSWFTQMSVGPISVNFQATQEGVDRCIAAITGELGKLGGADYVTLDELHRAAHSLEIDTVHDRERASQFASTITFWWASAGLPYYLGYVANAYKVDNAAAKHYVDTFITGKPFVLGVLVSPDMKKAGLDKKHFEALVKAGK